MAHTTLVKKVLVLSANARTCQAVTKALADDYSVFAAPCNQPDVASFVTTMKPHVLIVDPALVRAAASALRISAVEEEPGLRVGEDTTMDLPPIKNRGRLLALVEAKNQATVLTCFEHGADDYVSTPIFPEELRSKIDGLIGDMPPEQDTRKDSRGELARAGEEDDEEPAPIRIGRYEIHEEIGQGGYGTVYRSWDRLGEREVALKLLPKEATQSPESVERFLRESSALERLQHPNIVRFFDFGQADGRFYFTMELVDGIDLKDLADQQAPLDPAKAADYISQVARGLQAISALGFVHRDVKPENMILCPDGTVKLIDFGLVKIHDSVTITNENDVLGTPYYMGPEYITGNGLLDTRYDIYSLGVCFYVFLTGRYPYTGKNTAHVLEKHLRATPPRPSRYNPAVVQGLDDLVVRMLSKDPRHRPASPLALIRELRPYV